jgi:hypothetical protein
MPMPSDRDDFAQTYRKYYSILTSDENKIKFLLMLKERRDLRRDEVAGALLKELVERWTTEKFIA